MYSDPGFADARETEFVCIQPPIESNTAADGGALVYRVKHGAPLWNKSKAPKLEQLAETPPIHIDRQAYPVGWVIEAAEIFRGYVDRNCVARATLPDW